MNNNLFFIILQFYLFLHYKTYYLILKKIVNNMNIHVMKTNYLYSVHSFYYHNGIFYIYSFINFYTTNYYNIF